MIYFATNITIPITSVSIAIKIQQFERTFRFLNFISDELD